MANIVPEKPFISVNTPVATFDAVDCTVTVGTGVPDISTVFCEISPPQGSSHSMPYPCLKDAYYISISAMGIPSYYKRLIDRFPGIVRKGFKAIESDVLLMDFNCLIYQCIRGPDVPPYTADGRVEWERAVLSRVADYTRTVWMAAGKPSHVFIGVDGVVPMAKIRQQRLRRFKSRWLAAAELAAGVRRPGEDQWDTNAITPGTEFMERLGLTLRDLAAKHSGWTVSGADEAGEGEQKLMGWVRSNKDLVAKKRVTVYGLDADLIVLSLIGVAREVPSVASWSLLRELAEFESKRGPDDLFACLDIHQLLGVVCIKGMSPSEYILEYACGMSFLGNDFLPHSLSVTMKDTGHETMVKTLGELHRAGLRLVLDGVVQRKACAELVRLWAKDEDVHICKGFEHKYKMRPMAPRNERERLMADTENLPIEWKAESGMWNLYTGLIPEWRDVYRQSWLKEATAEQVGAQYELGLQWILDYYLGKPISYSWYFPWSVPPLWADLVGQFSVGSKGFVAPAPSSPVAPQEQLAMVLPMESWWLVRNPKLRGLPLKAPVFWPTSFGFFSAGRRWLWECEPELPVISVERLRQLV
jgi:5'-3' exonuclease